MEEVVVANLEGKSERRSIFAIYKPGQGKWVRWGTVAGMAIVATCGAYWLATKQAQLINTSVIVRSLVAVVWMLLWAAGTFWLVNSPKLGEFMIMTESEMRKVSWPSRREVVNSTKVIIILTVLLGALLWLVDMGFVQLFQAIGLT